MPLPTIDEALAKLAANPQAAAEYDSATAQSNPKLSRRECVAKTLKAMDARIVSLRQEKQALLKKAEAKKLVAQLKPIPKPASVIKPVAVIKPAPKAAPAPALSQTPLADTLLSLTGADKTTFYRQHERALRIEAIKKSNPKTIMPTIPNPPSQPTTAAAFATPQITMTRAEFSKLSPSDKSRLVKQGGKIIN